MKIIDYKKFLKFSKISNFKKKKLTFFLKEMLKIRLVEDFLGKKKKDGCFRSPVHLSIGQEAISVAVSNNLKINDIVYGNHRSHHHLLALGQNIKKFFSEILTKKNGVSKGRGASMHLFNPKIKFYGSVPIVSGTIPLAVGSALEQKINNKKNLTIVYMGDGASEEGVFHEALNFSSLHELPIVFIVENNFYASHLQILTRQKKHNISRFANVNNIKSLELNGNDVTKIYIETSKIFKKIRKKSSPFLLELYTYRQRGHVDWREDLDVGIDRNKKILDLWKQNDPIKKLKEALIKQNFISENYFQKLEKDFNLKITKSWKMALSSKEIPIREILKYTYKD